MASDTPALPALTGLRFVAAAGVVAYHAASAWIDAAAPAFVAAAVGRGFVGVQLFFVLSGFILAYVYAGVRGSSRRRYGVARVARIYPLYVVALVVAAPFFVVGAANAETSLGMTLVSAVTAITLTHAWSPATACEWNCPGWTLSVEAFCYLLFPFALPLVERLRRGSALLAGLALAAVSLSIAAAVAASAPPGSQLRAAVQFLPAYRALEFGVGMLAARVFLLDRARLAPRVPVALGGAAGAAVLLAVTFPIPGAHYLYETSLLTVPFAVLVYALAHGGGALARALSSRPVLALGEASYALYLLHVPILMGVAFAARRVGVEPVGPGPALVGVVLSLAAALVAFRLVERPARARILAWHAAHAQRTPTRAPAKAAL